MNKARFAVVAGVVLGILLMFLVSGFILGRIVTAPGTLRSLNSATLLTHMQGLAELVTVKYILQRPVVEEDWKPYGENRVVVLACGVVKAGVDLAKLKPEDVVLSPGKVTLRLPWATITDVYLDEKETQVLEHSTGLLRRFDKDLPQAARREALEAIRRDARYTGIIDDANARAHLVVSLFLKQLGVETVEFIK